MRGLTFVEIRVSRGEVVVNARQDRLLALLQEIDEEQGEGVSRQGPLGLSVNPAELRPQSQRGRQRPHSWIQLEVVSDKKRD